MRTVAFLHFRIYDIKCNWFEEGWFSSPGDNLKKNKLVSTNRNGEISTCNKEIKGFFSKIFANIKEEKAK